MKEYSDLPSDATQLQRLAKANKYERLKKLESDIAVIIQNANHEAMRLSQWEWKSIYGLNYDYGAYFIETSTSNVGIIPILPRNAIGGIVTGEYTPFTMLAIKDLELKSETVVALTRQFTTGLALGESIPQIARRIRGVTQSNYKRSIRIARTETTRIQNQARQDVFTYAQDKMGIKQTKEWVATHGSRTRDTHRRADGQTVPLDEPFRVGGDKMQYPGDSSGSAKEVVNCRCTTITHIEGLEEYESDRMTYDKWEKERAKVQKGD